MSALLDSTATASPMDNAAATASAPLLSQPIPFVTMSDDSTFEIAPEAVAYLKQIKGAVAIVAIAGLYRTGKSYMLNLLLGRDRAEAMFNVGATVNACTKGIWIWGQPVQLSAVADLAAERAFKHLPHDTTIVFMDTEGLGSAQRSQTQDTRIFALALLLSSLFIYNSRGVIDSSAIEDLSLVVHLTKFIQAKAHALHGNNSSSKNNDDADDDDDDSSALAAFFPDFLWVVRDFTLRLQEDGRAMTPRDYFESALKHQPPMTDEIVQKNRVRTLLSTFFPTRDCVTMVRPLHDESLLRDLIHQPYESLRSEFRDQMAVLKTKVFGSLKPKQMLARPLNGAMLVTLAQNYVDAFNSGTSPVIATVWDRVIESQCDEALERAKHVFTQHLEHAIASASPAVDVNRQLLPQPLDASTLHELYEQARAVAETELEHDENLAASASLVAYYEQLSSFMLEALTDAYDRIERDSLAFNRALLAELCQQQQQQQQSTSESGASDSDGLQHLQDTLAHAHTQIHATVASYRERARGVAASAVLSAFLTVTIVDGLVDWGAVVKTTYRTRETQLEREAAALKQSLRAIESKVRIAEELLTTQRASYERALQAIAERTDNERSALTDEIETTNAAIARTRLEIEHLASLHTEALAQLEAQLEASKTEYQRLDASVRAEQARRESERQDAARQLLESERSFHREEKDLLQNQQQYLTRVIELEQELGELDTQQMQEIFRLEKARQQQTTSLQLQFQTDREALKERTIQEIRSLKREQDDELAALNDELNDETAALSSLREQLETRTAIVERKRAKATACVLQ